MLTRRDFVMTGLRLSGAGALALAGCGDGSAREKAATSDASPKVVRIGYVTPGFVRMAAQPEALVRELAALGYVEGQTMTLTSLAGLSGDFASPIAELIEVPVDILVAANELVARAALTATSTIPIVATFNADPVAQGLVASLARPGANLTGVGSFGLRLAAKRVELLHEAFPAVARVAYMWQTGAANADEAFAETRRAAEARGLTLLSIDYNEYGEVAAAVEAAVAAGAEALLFNNNIVFTRRLQTLLPLVEQHRLPAMFSNAVIPNTSGGLMGISAQAEVERRTAGLVDRIARGAKPADLPVERVTGIDFVVDLRAAERIGASIPAGVLAQATKVVR